MSKSIRIVFAAASALAAGAFVAPAQAGPISAGAGSAVRDAVPDTTSEVGWGGRGHGFHGGGFRRRAHFHHHRHWGRPWHARHGFVRVGYLGPACVWRPARVVFTPYGERFVPARRVCGI